MHDTSTDRLRHVAQTVSWLGVTVWLTSFGVFFLSFWAAS